MNSNKGQIKDSVTPHKLCVALLIRQFCLFRESNNCARIVPPIQRRDFCLLILELIQSPDLTLSELRYLLFGTYNIDPRFVAKFEYALRDLYYVGLNNLLDVTESISRLTTDLQLNSIWCHVNKNSVLGCYIRRLMVTFDKLTFSEVTAVFEGFKEYYEPCASEIDAPRKYLPPTSTKNNGLNPISLYNSKHWSKTQGELFIATQSALISNNEVAAQTPIQLSKQITSLLKSHPDLPEAHFLNYMNYLRVKEFCGAIDSLYHSFDRSTPVNENKNNNIDEKFKGYRYAALNLAVLHVHFGHKEEALAALKESIKVAQEANDDICLQHALTWLYKLTNANKELLMHHCIVKSKHLNLPYITSISIQSFAQYVGLNGFTPKYVFEIMVKSDIINCQNSYRDLITSNFSQKASLWLLYGKTELSSLSSQLLLHLNSDNLISSKIYNGEGTCQAICHVANNLLLDGEYSQALTLLKFARKKFPNEPISHNWMLCEYVFTFIKALNNGDWSTAEVAAVQIASVDKWESLLRMASLQIAKSDYKSAQDFINHVLYNTEHDCDIKLEINTKIRAIILLAELHCMNFSVGNIPTNIITALNSALNTANLYHLEYLTACIHMYLANIQLLMGLPSQALKILDKHLVEILTHGGTFDIARAMLLYVKCIIADSGFNCSQDRYSVILEATEILKKVQEDFHKVEARSRVKDVLYLQAQLYNEIDHFEDRNNCALEYKQYQQDFLTKNSKSCLFTF